MTKVLVLYYSTWGHIEQMANAAAEGARSAGAEVVIAAPRAVKDVSARAFMVDLYSHLVNADASALEEAYRKALLTADQTDAQMFRLVVQ